MKACSIEGCDEPARGRGWCQAHYMIWYRRHGRRKVVGVCSVDGCGRQIKCRELCVTHYARLSRGQSLTAPLRSVFRGVPRASTLLEYILYRTVPQDDGCWLFIGACTDKGYGLVHFRGTNGAAHKRLWEILVGPDEGQTDRDYMIELRSKIIPAARLASQPLPSEPEEQ